jgi:hypothetical protein
MPLVQAGGESREPIHNDAHERARKIRPELTRGELVRVAGGRNQPEAELIQNILLEEGVPSILRRSAGFDVPDFLAAGPRDVMVPESGAELARATLSSADIEPAPLRPVTTAAPGRQALLITVALVVGGLLAAFAAWELIRLAG